MFPTHPRAKNKQKPPFLPPQFGVFLLFEQKATQKVFPMLCKEAKRKEKPN